MCFFCMEEASKIYIALKVYDMESHTGIYKGKWSYPRMWRYTWKFEIRYVSIIGLYLLRKSHLCEWIPPKCVLYYKL